MFVISLLTFLGKCIILKFMNFASSLIMHRNAAVLSVTCILLCLTFNYTFPLHRDIGNPNGNPYINLSLICDKSEHLEKIRKPNKKMSSSIEMALKRIKDSSQKFSKNLQSRFVRTKPDFTEEDLRQYEQLVIKKKNPYIDLKQIERYSPNEKSIRQSAKFNIDPMPYNYIEEDPSFWEALEEGLNVEITNRGLTGFAIPVKMIKPSILKQNPLDQSAKKKEDNAF